MKPLAKMLAALPLSLLLLLPAGCRTSAPGDHRGPREGFPLELLDRPAGEVPAGLATALPNLREGDHPFHRGDRLTFQVELLDEGGTTVHFLDLAVLGPTMVDGEHSTTTMTMTIAGEETKIDSPSHGITLSLLGADGVPVESSRVSLSEAVVQDHTAAVRAAEQLRGMVHQAELHGTPERPPTEMELEYARLEESLVLSVRSLIALQGLALDDDLLADLAWSVIDKPDLLSVVANLGVHVTLVVQYEDARVLASPPEHLEGACWLPLELLVNDTPALELDLLVVPPRPPHSVTGGILAFEARHPRLDRRLRARLVGASHGSAVDAPAD